MTDPHTRGEGRKRQVGREVRAVIAGWGRMRLRRVRMQLFRVRMWWPRLRRGSEADESGPADDATELSSLSTLFLYTYL